MVGLSPDGQTVLYGLGLTATSLVLFALLPARFGSSVQPAMGLSRARGGAPGRSSRKVMNTLVAAETALAVLLVLGAGLVLRSLYELQRVDLGFPVEDMASAWVSLPGATSIPMPEKLQFYTRLEVAQNGGRVLAELAHSYRADARNAVPGHIHSNCHVCAHHIVWIRA